VVVDVEPVDRIGVEPVALREGVRVHDQHGSAGVIGRREHEEIGQVQTGIVARGLEVRGTEVVRHWSSFGVWCRVGDTSGWRCQYPLPPPLEVGAGAAAPEGVTSCQRPPKAVIPLLLAWPGAVSAR